MWSRSFSLATKRWGEGDHAYTKSASSLHSLVLRPIDTSMLCPISAIKVSHSTIGDKTIVHALICNVEVYDY